MRTIVTFGLLILVASMVLGGATSNGYAQDDGSTMLLKLAKRAQTQIENQISSESPDEIKKLFKEGVQNVDSLEKAIKDNDTDSAKKHFLTAMKIFTKILRQTTESDVASKESSSSEVATKTTSDSARLTVKDPSNDLQRLQVYVNSLKTIAKKYNASIDFSNLDESFRLSKQQINDNQFALALNTLQNIKEMIREVTEEIRDEASKQ